MQLKIKTILNFKENHSGFVYKDIRLSQKKEDSRIEVKIEARKGSEGICSSCGKKGSGYDHLAEREFIHVPLWGPTGYFFILYEAFTMS